MKFIPHDYQAFCIDYLLEHPAAGLLLDMGLGKTVITLTALDRLLYDSFAVSRVLVIAPLRVAMNTWSTETRKWDHLRHLRISKVLGSREQRLAALSADADIYIINRENVTWLVDHYGLDWPFDAVVVDELSSFKSARARRFKSLRKVRPLVRIFWGLTGTPAPNGLIDLWPQVYLLDMGERLGKTLGGYRDTYFKPGRRNGYVVYDWIPRPGAEEQIYQLIGDICVSMKAADHLTLPERVDVTVPVLLDEDTLELYAEMEAEAVLPLANEAIIDAGSAAAVSGKLMQMANGAVYDEDRQVHEIHKAKLDALEDLVEAANGQSVLVFYAYQHDLDRIRARFPQAVKLEGPEAIDAWNRGEISMLLAHPASAGHGLNLQDGGRIVIWFGLTWSLELYQQACARLYRQGQREAVTVFHLVAQDTVDEDAMRVLEGKASRQDAMLEAVKARLKKYGIKGGDL